MKRILIVDDSEDVREFFAFVLTDAGYSVDSAANGEEGFVKVRDERPDLVLLDVVMPGMDGFELLLKLRSDLAPPVPPIILCSGFDVTEEEALRRGASRFVRKPVDPRDLLALVADLFAGRPADAETLSRERAHAMLARQRAAALARQLRDEIAARQPSLRAQHDQTAFAHASQLAHYLGVDAVALTFLQGDRLLVMAASEDAVLTPGLDLGELLPPALAIIETGSSLILPDVPLHPCFGRFCDGLPGIRGFAGVPVLVENVAIGVLCVFASHPVGFEPEDQAVMRGFCEQSAAVLSAWAHDRPEADLPTRYGPGILTRYLFEQALDAELRLLDRKGGSMELAVLSLTDLDALRAAFARVTSTQRMFAGVLSDHRVAIYKRSEDTHARAALADALDQIRARAEAQAAGVVDLAVAGLSPFGAPDLIRIAELALDKTLQASSGGLHRLIIEERPVSH